MTGIITSIPPLVEQPPGNNANNPAGLPGVTYTAAIPTLPQTWTGLQTFSGGVVINGGTFTSTATGNHYQSTGANIHRLADRVFMGDATKNTGQNVVSQPDWLTTFQLGTGRVAGFIQLSQGAILNGSDPSDSNTLTVGAQTKNITLTGLNAIGSINVGVNNNPSTTNVTAFASYNEAYRMSGALGGAVGYEIDTVNYASTVNIDPFAQNIGQTIGLQLAAGAELSSVGQFPSTAAINIRNNNSSYRMGIIFGNNAIDGTNGTDGGTGQAIAMATGHLIEYFYSAGAVSWQLGAATGGNGDYNFTSFGSGSVAVPSLKTSSLVFGTGAASNIAAASTNTGFQNTFAVQNNGSVSNSGTLAVSSVALTAAAGSYVQTVVQGGASPAGQITSGAGLTGGLTISAGAGTLTLASPTLTNAALGTPVSGVATNLTGTAAGLTAGNATKLATARTIGIGGTTGLTATGVNFDGSANITQTLTGTLAVANGGTGATSIAGAQAALSVGILAFTLPAANFNSTADQAIAISLPTGYTRYTIQRITISNPSIPMTNAVGGFYTAAAKGGVTVVTAAQVYSSLTTNAANTSGNKIELVITNQNTIAFSAATLFLSLTTPQGAAATADVTVFIQPLP